MHVPPFGPVALVCLSCAGLLIEREREAWMRAHMTRISQTALAS